MDGDRDREAVAAALQRFLDGMVAAGVATAAVGLVGDAGGALWEGAAGSARPEVRAASGTVFDFASITKPFVGTLALILDREGALPLASRIGDVLPRAAAPLGGRSLESLLRHRSGIAGWWPLYHEAFRSRAGGGPAAIAALLASADLPASPVPTYSDPGFLLWARAAEARLGEPLASLLSRHVLQPLAMVATPPPGDRPEVALCRMGTGQEIALAARAGLVLEELGAPPPGLPQDGNARFLYDLGVPVAGHAGLFGTAGDLYRLGAEWLAPGRLLDREHVSRALAGTGPFALGWWRRRARTGGGGGALSRSAFGITGFAGGNLWIDPQAGRVYVLLASRTDPFTDFNSWRRRFHEAAAAL
jgi:CubicO group peptidase (beta-lactamase class C family)